MELNNLSPLEMRKLENTVNNYNSKIKKNQAGKEEMGKSEFLRILTTQLSHQNPLQPMDNTQFISQMAQFSSLEQMQNMNKTLDSFKGDFSSLQSAGLIGKEAKYADYNGEIHTGVIEEVRLKDNEVIINGEEIAVKELISVRDIAQEKKIDVASMMNQYEKNMKQQPLPKEAVVESNEINQ